MSKLHVKPASGTGRTIDITPQSAGWTYVGFALHRLSPGETAKGSESDRETCLVFVAGKGKVIADGKDLGELGQRMSPFEGKPWSVYIPAGASWSVAATTDLELAVCTAPGRPRSHPVRVIVPETDPAADSLLVVEVITPGGHTSSYPPHKHDQDDLPHESLLEETYYHRLNPPQGYAFQRVYTDADETGKRKLDEVMVVEDGDATMVPEGYHPCAAIHGYDLYYLNVMAGPKRTWKFHNAPEHEWLLKA